MDGSKNPDMSIYVNDNNPALNQDEIDIIYSFFKIFENENKRASIDAMVQNISNMEEFNTEIVRRVLSWMSRHSSSPCKINRC